MPIYEYKCDLCNGLWEEIQKFSDDPLTVCKSCEKEGGVHKLLPGRIAFHLKGDGWYKDGYSAESTDSVHQKNLDKYNVSGETGTTTSTTIDNTTITTTTAKE